MASGHDGFARQILIDHLRHLSRRNADSPSRTLQGDRPPAYDDVVKDGVVVQQNEASATADSDEVDAEVEPPSYIEAMETCGNAEHEEPAPQERWNANGQYQVVTIEINPDTATSSTTTTTSISYLSPSQSSSPSERQQAVIHC